MGPELEKRELDTSAARTAAEVVCYFARLFSVRQEEVWGRCQSARAVAARVCCWRLLRSWGWSYPEIGKAFGRDHSTVLQGLKGKG